MIKSRPPRRGRRLPLALFFLSPLVGEYLLGNTPISDVASLLLLAPLYGGGALLIREIARRTGRGWPTMILFAAAYALLEEGPIDMMLWNPHYAGVSMAAAYPGTAIPFLGTSGQLLQDTLAVHTIWSISVPIAITETFSRDPTRPWLGKKALTAVAVMFVLAAFLPSAAQIAESKFIASPAELAWCAAAIVSLIVRGFRRGRWQEPPRDTKAPRPWVVGAAGCALFALSAVLCTRWSRSRCWDAAHRLALAAGALLTYVWLGILNSQALHVSPVTMVSGSVVFGTGAIALLILAARRIR